MRILRTIDRLRLKNKDFTILCNNCIGGLIYHKHHLPFLSPTINMQMSPYDFIKFCANLSRYLDIELEEVTDCDDKWFRSIGGGAINFPVAHLDDILIYFQHYHSFAEAKEAWNRRKARINFDNIFIVLLDNWPSNNIINRFNKLPYKHKIYLYYHGNYTQKNCFKLQHLEDTDLAWYQDMPRWFLKKKFYEQFDFEKWLNSYQPKQK